MLKNVKTIISIFTYFFIFHLQAPTQLPIVQTKHRYDNTYPYISTYTHTHIIHRYKMRYTNVNYTMILDTTYSSHRRGFPVAINRPLSKPRSRIHTIHCTCHKQVHVLVHPIPEVRVQHGQILAADGRVLQHKI